jgi:mRNA-degrading endonuclease RelE of RelBE toxin-antitoxin system
VNVYLHPKADKALKKLDRVAQEELASKIRQLAANPVLGKTITPSRFRSVRAGDYRAIYEIADDKIVVLFVGHRKNVYDDFLKLL